MRILHVVVGKPKKEASNGVLKSVYLLSQGQSLLGQTVEILSLGKRRPENHNWVNNVAVHFGIHNRFVPILCKYTHAVIEGANKNYDLVHFHSAFHIQYLPIARKLIKLGIPYVVSPRGSYQPHALKKNRYAKFVFKYLFENNFIKNSAYVHTLNKGESEGAFKFGVPSSKISVVPNGVDFVNIPRKKVLLGKLEADCASLIYCGRLDYYGKGLDVLLDTIGLLRTKMGLPVSLNIVGSGSKSDLRLVERHIKKLDIADCVILSGTLYAEEKYAAYSEANLFILPSRSEGFPTSVLEAMAFGIPCLVTPECNIPAEIVSKGGVILSKLTSTDLAKNIADFCRDFEASDNLSVRGKKLAKAYFCIEHVSNLHLLEYKTRASLSVE